MTPRSKQPPWCGARLSLCIYSLAACVVAVAPLRSQDVTEASLRAAYLHKFVIFTEWTRDVLPTAAPIKACVLGGGAFSEVLAAVVKGNPVDGHAIVVSSVAIDGPLRSCHLLYMSGLPGKQAQTVVAGLTGAPVLTLSDADQFAQSGGGMVQLYVENGKIRFRVNLGTVKRARLQLSSRLLSLADIVE